MSNRYDAFIETSTGVIVTTDSDDEGGVREVHISRAGLPESVSFYVNFPSGYQAYLDVVEHLVSLATKIEEPE
jgi:hypothetical protein